ncbi:MAG: hypothetical protein GEU92_05750 [Alphaproteobacteria bacterium]|nr:hypothetical protein [Alphaproteobacteria bacterium]
MNGGLLLSDFEIALNEVFEACVQAADIHAAAAEHSDGAQLRPDLEALGRRRAETSEWAGDYLAKYGEGPNRPSEEMELVKKAVTHARSVFGTDSVLAGCRAAEERVRDSAYRALPLTEDRALRQKLETLSRDAATLVNMFDSHIGPKNGEG